MTPAKIVSFRRRNVDEALAAGEDAVAIMSDLEVQIDRLKLRVQNLNTFLESLLRDTNAAA